MLLNNNGTCKFYSFRDPQTTKTYSNYKNCCDWLSSKDLSQRELDNYIISNVAKIDAPLPARAIINYLDTCYFCDIPDDHRKITRNEIISTSLDDIKSSAQKIKTQMKTSNKCVFGGLALDSLKDAGFKIVDLFSV